MVSIFNEINLRNLHGDILGGVTAAVIALPMALAFGVASGAGAEVGLYGAIMVGLFAALFGGSPSLISEPTGPMTVVFTAVIAKLIATNPENGMAMAFTVVVMAGMFQILFGAMRLGKYVTLMPYSVISGFMSGIGIILIVLQFGPMLGQATPQGGVLSVLQSVPEIIANAKLPEVMLGVLTMVILFFMPSGLKRYMPPQLLALIAGTLLSVWLLGSDEVRRIGEIPAGLPSLQIPVFSTDEWQLMLVDAIVLGMLGSIDALLTSVIADSLTRKQHNSNKELVGQGIGNMMSGLFGGLPGAGATMGTVVNIQTGGRTALSGLVRAAVLIVIVLWASGLTAFIPLAVLSGIALKVGIDIIDWRFLKRAHRLSVKGTVITYGVIMLTVFVDLIAAVGIGLFLANVLTITRLSEIQESDVEVIGSDKESQESLTAYEKDLMTTANDSVLLLSLTGTLIFGVSRVISKKNCALMDCNTLIIDLAEVRHLGVSAALALEESIKDMLAVNKNVFIVHADGQPMQRLDDLRILSSIPQSNIFTDRRKAIEWAVYGTQENNHDDADAPEEIHADSDQKNIAVG